MASQEQILVIGSEGMIGRSLADRLAAQGKLVVRTSRKGEAGSMPLDLGGDLDSWGSPSEVSIAYLCAASTSLERCRQYPAATRAINVSGTLRLAEALMRSGVFVVFLSSNLVFDGSSPCTTTDTPTNPMVEYGRQKSEVERQLLQSGGRCCIVRLTKVLGTGDRLLCGWRNALLRASMIRPFCDMVMAPVSVEFAVEALELIGAKRHGGIVHVSAQRDISYEQAARHVARRLGVPGNLISPVLVAESGLTPEWVPRHTTLDTSRLSAEYGLSAPSEWIAVERAIG